MPRGHIISAEKDRYELAPTQDSDWTGRVFARGRGVLRERDLRPMIGDYVLWTKAEQDEEATIMEVLPRKNQLLRPPVANVDQVLVVETLVEPVVNALQLDKLLAVLEKRHFPILLCFTKMDCTAKALRETWEARYRPTGYPLFFIYSLHGTGLTELENVLEGRMTAIAGPSGAGKSTLIQRLSGEQSIVIGELSEKTARGKQTTRTSRLFSLGEKTFIFDTPGFSTLDLRDFSNPAELAAVFPEMARIKEKCQFRNCSHRREPHCAIKEAIARGEIAQERYASYLRLYDEMEKNTFR